MLIRKLAARLGMAPELLHDMAHTLIASRNAKAVDNFDLNISELLAAEQAVSEFKKNK